MVSLVTILFWFVVVLSNWMTDVSGVRGESICGVFFCFFEVL